MMGLDRVVKGAADIYVLEEFLIKRVEIKPVYDKQCPSTDLFTHKPSLSSDTDC